MSNKNKVLSEINKQLSIHTSTPNRPKCLSIMDFSFLKCYENIPCGSQVYTVDSDSGYMSNPLEGTLDKEDPTMFINRSPPYMSEDALLEKPVSVKKSRPNQDVYQEQISYLSAMNDDPPMNLMDGSIVPESEEEELLSPIIPIRTMPMVITFALDDCSNSSNKENEGSFAQESYEKISRVKMTPRKTPRKRRRSSSSSTSSLLRSTTPNKPIINTRTADASPDLFDDDLSERWISNTEPVPGAAQEQYVQKLDELLAKRVGQCLSGVLPPPSVTTTQITVAQMLEKLRSPKHQMYFWTESNNSNSIANIDMDDKQSLICNTADLGSCTSRGWPSVLHDRHHGLNYNYGKLAEDTEALFMRYAQRYIGAETQSSCTIFDSRLNTPSKRKANRLRWVNNSPGRRLSHLARRRITFSSANIQAGSSTSRQIMIDAKRFDLLSRRISPRKSDKSPRKTPRKGKSPRRSETPRKTPGKSPRARLPMCTPSSSTKKRLAFKVLDEGNTAPSTSASRASATKRALFQSPEKEAPILTTRVARPSTSSASLSPWKKRSTPKRALFMSPSKTQGNKRKRLESGSSDLGETSNCKFGRSISLQCENQVNRTMNTIPRTKSESLLNGQVPELSDHHKKKLQWAVYEALRSVNIRVENEKFKQYASVLARVTRRLLPTLSSAGAGTSERMLRLTKQHVYSVTKGMTMEEIIRNYENSRLKVHKPTGYIRKEDLEDANRQLHHGADVLLAPSSNALQDCANTIQSTEKKSIVAEKKIDNKVDRVKKIIKF